MWYVIAGIGIGLLLTAVGCGVFAALLDRRLAAMRSVGTMSASEAARYQISGGAGQRCEVAGTVECDGPLSAPLSGKLCVAYSHQVMRHVTNGVHSAFEEKPRYAREYSEVDPADVRTTRFYVRDASGRILVDPAWATLDMARQGERADATTYNVGSARAQNVGVWEVEDALPLGSTVYVLGYLGEVYGEPALVAHPTDRKQPFLVSHRSERALTRSATVRSNVLYLLAGVAAAFGVAMTWLAATRLL